MFNKEEYQEWRQVRLNFLINRFGEDFFRNKKILELGSGYGHLGNEISKYGATIHCCDARIQNVEMTRKMFPHLNVEVVDLNVDWPYKKDEFDVIIHFGVLYHLNCDLHSHLEKVCNSTKGWLFLESEVVDSLDSNFSLIVKENIDQDQSINSMGTRYSPSVIEKALDKNKMKHELCLNKSLNCHVGWYDWSHVNDKSWKKIRSNTSNK
jgi:2-polyprenyl-3-methyl-5-hydroxy-6-metoxy-1,4-benzoquinol methylase